jgi:hypothetical protein
MSSNSGISSSQSTIGDRSAGSRPPQEEDGGRLPSTGIAEETTIACNVAYQQAVEATHRALAELGASIGHADPATGLIQAQKSMGMATWGENKKNLTAFEGSLRRQLGGCGGAWHPDPTGRHEHHWFDGQQSSGSVSDAGVTATDPL